MALNYHVGDERPAWQATVTLNGVAENYTTGFTFRVQVIDVTGAVTLTKTTNITGAPVGVVTVAWAPGELDIAPGRYTARLRVTRTSDGLDFTVEEPMTVVAA